LGLSGRESGWFMGESQVGAWARFEVVVGLDHSWYLRVQVSKVDFIFEALRY